MADRWWDQAVYPAGLPSLIENLQIEHGLLRSVCTSSGTKLNTILVAQTTMTAVEAAKRRSHRSWPPQILFLIMAITGMAITL